jgi:hypothetical protein
MAHSKTSKTAVRWPVDPKAVDRKAADPKAPNSRAADSKAEEKPAGRITHDERGNAVYGRASGDSTSTMLRRLELPGLKVEGQEAPPSVEEILEGKGNATPRPDPGGGYNPYDQSKAVKKPTKPKGPIGRRTR